MTVEGLLLAAGAGSRMGRPKALMTDADGTSWLRRAVATLRDGGCDGVVVVLGARADDARTLLEDLDVVVVVADAWAEGMSASLVAGLRELGEVDAALVSLVDLPDVGADVVARVLAEVTGPGSLARATYEGRPGHPVLLGRGHWEGVMSGATGDEGARRYLADHRPVLVECGDLARGHDVDALSDPTGGSAA